MQLCAHISANTVGSQSQHAARIQTFGFWICVEQVTAVKNIYILFTFYLHNPGLKIKRDTIILFLKN